MYSVMPTVTLMFTVLVSAFVSKCCRRIDFIFCEQYQSIMTASIMSSAFMVDSWTIAKTKDTRYDRSIDLSLSAAFASSTITLTSAFVSIIGRALIVDCSFNGSISAEVYPPSKDFDFA